MNQKDRRHIVEIAKVFAILGDTDDMILAKIVRKCSGDARDYRGHLSQAKKELKYAEIAEKAVLKHVQLGGEVHRNPKKFANFVQMGPTKPECPYGALVVECKKLVNKWSSESLEYSDWRRRVDFAKDALVKYSVEEAMELLIARWKGDNKLLRQKVLAVANRELAKNAKITLMEAAVNPGKKSGQGKKAKKAVKAARRKLDAKRLERIFGQKAA